MRSSAFAESVKLNDMTEPLKSKLTGILQAAACIVVIAWGVAAAAHLISIFLLAMLLAYCVLPLPKWIMRRFKFGKGTAIALSVTLVGAGYLVLSAYLVSAAYRMTAKLPVYQERLTAVYDSLVPFLVVHGVPSSTISSATTLSPDRIIGFAHVVLPMVLGSFSQALLISLLSLLFAIELLEEPSRQNPLVAGLTYYGRDVQRFIAISAKTGAITTLINLVLLLALGVDFPLLWCVLYFFLQFIPNLGSIVALVPPALLALLMFGWHRALLVAVGMLVTNMVTANVLNPFFLKKGVNVSFLEMTLSLIVWGALLGFWGGIVAIPLTLVLRRFFGNSPAEATPVALAG